MNFVYDLPRTRNGHDGIWVIVDRLTKSAHFLPVWKNYKLERLAKLYVIVRLHSVPSRLSPIVTHVSLQSSGLV